MHFLIYTSSASTLMSDAELTTLLERCRVRNDEGDITGMLLYKDGSFMQALEGDKEAVFETYDRILKDARHKDITLLREGPSDGRSFSGWSMGFKTLNKEDLKNEPGFAQLSGEVFSSPAFTGKPHIALRLLKSFHQNTG